MTGRGEWYNEKNYPVLCTEYRVSADVGGGAWDFCCISLSAKIQVNVTRMVAPLGIDPGYASLAGMSQMM